ncbi:general transcription factor II-I repeat domain-containing protein 2-like [Sipha flava]|uniref:General transcription factor II-I repeat domain-containing protein 2-like n=1 Tax=Sipha flava TaxID=143950 RepID=A0A8B8GI45_9HEMI|nr:general transcription factor II-I repeat domain-containing protein 2-like [Sipha flava]
MKKSDLSYDKIVSISTDGAPAMMGKEKGLLKIIRDNNSGILTYQCIIHQTSLCSKLSATLKDVMDSLINFIRSRSSLQHRQFKEFLCQFDSAYSDLLQHNHVRWLSKGRVVERFWNIKEEVKTFLKNVDTEEAKKHSDFLENNRNIVAMTFLNDILKYFNTLNVELQGEGRLICDLIQNGEWTDVAEKLFNLSKSKLQMEIINLQEDVSLKQYRSASTEEFWAKDAID